MPPGPSPVRLAGLFWLQAGRKNNTVAGVQNIRGLLFFEVRLHAPATAMHLMCCRLSFATACC